MDAQGLCAAAVILHQTDRAVTAQNSFFKGDPHRCRHIQILGRCTVPVIAVGTALAGTPGTRAPEAAASRSSGACTGRPEASRSPAGSCGASEQIFKKIAVVGIAAFKTEA